MSEYWRESPNFEKMIFENSKNDSDHILKLAKEIDFLNKLVHDAADLIYGSWSGEKNSEEGKWFNLYDRYYGFIKSKRRERRR